MPDSGILPPARVVVLGAGGFIGSRLTAALAHVPGVQPVAVVRRRGKLRDAGGRDAAVVVCDATDRGGLAEALAGATHAVNCVAGNDAAMVKATAALCDTARRAGLARIVHLSSMAVYGAATGPVTEASPPVVPLSGYGAAKQACEQAVHAFVADGGAAAILRPGCVYGPGSEQWSGRIARLLRAGRLGDLGASGDGLANLTYIDDLVSAIVTALSHPSAADATFNIAMAEPPTWNAYLMRFARALGATPVRRIPSRQLALETRLAAPALRIGAIGLRAAHLPLRMPEAVTPSLARLFRHDIRLNVQRSRERLGLHETPLEHGLTAAAAWLAGDRQGPSPQPHDRIVEVPQR